MDAAIRSGLLLLPSALDVAFSRWADHGPPLLTL